MMVVEVMIIMDDGYDGSDDGVGSINGSSRRNEVNGSISHNGNDVIMEDRGYNDGGSSGNGSDNNSSDNGGDSGHSNGYGYCYGYGYGYDPKKLPGVRLCAMRDRQERLSLSLFGINIARQVSPNLLPENNGIFFR